MRIRGCLLVAWSTTRFDSSTAWLLPSVPRVSRSWRRSDIVVRHNQPDESTERDVLDSFDPLLSPHAYPKGVDAGVATDSTIPAMGVSPLDSKSDTSVSTGTDDSYDMLGWGGQAPAASKSRKLKVFGLDLPDTNEITIPSAPTTYVSTDVFDPTLSPHVYTKGTPSVVANGPVLAVPPPPSRTIGVLLIDHGSRNSASNQRLHDLAQLYQDQQTPSPSRGSLTKIIQAAHMEIAEPSIAQGLAALMRDHPHLDEIVCHPYFLSPGRHVVEDIPTLVAAAVSDLGISIPVRLTPPVGSRTEIMLSVIDSLVQDTQVERSP